MASSSSDRPALPHSDALQGLTGAVTLTPQSAPLVFAVALRDQKFELCDRLLRADVDVLASVDADYEWRQFLLTPAVLCAALRDGNQDGVRYLLDNGANAFVSESEERPTPMDVARDESTPEMHKFFRALLAAQHGRRERQVHDMHSEIQTYYERFDAHYRPFPTSYEPMVWPHKTLLSLFWDRCTQSATAGVDALMERPVSVVRGREQDWVATTWREYGRQACAVGRSLLALGFLQSRDAQQKPKIAVLSRNCTRFMFADMGAMSIGAVTFGIYCSEAPSGVRYALDDSGARILFVDTVEQLRKTDDFRAQMSEDFRVVVFYPNMDQMPRDDPRVLTWDAFIALGSGRSDNVEEMGRAVQPDELCMMVYTSGTTGNPKGVMYSHANLAYMCEFIVCELGREPFSILSFLPLCHIAERIQGQLLHIAKASLTYFGESIYTVLRDMQAVRPSMLLCVPRLWQKIHDEMRKSVEKRGVVARSLFNYALSVGNEVRKLRNSNRPIPLLLQTKWLTMQRLVVNKVKRTLGLDRAVFLASDAGPLSREVSEFFGSLDLDIFEVYGSSECTGICTANPRYGVRPGCVGLPIYGTHVRLGAKCEILVKGPGVSLGYYGDAQKTRDAFDADGWLHTGDVGEWTTEGYLRITDRLKEFIKTEGGKMIAPAQIEQRFKMFPAISQAVLIGDRQKYVVALLCLDESSKPTEVDGRTVNVKTTLVDFLRSDCGIEVPDVTNVSAAQYVGDERVQRVIQAYVDQVNDGCPRMPEALPRYEQIKGFVLLDTEFSIDGGELTPTLKIKRRVIQQKYADVIADLYRRTDASFAARATGGGSAE